MKTSHKKLTQKAIALVVIIALLDAVGFAPVFLVFFVITGVIAWRVIHQTDRNETREIFDFFIAADEILRDEERRWYGFEISEVIREGERLIYSMPDPPPLLHFALGALYFRLGNFPAAINELDRLGDDGVSQERQVHAPSPQLRRYVRMLRRIEREPAIAPQALAAARGLERLRRTRLSAMLTQSRERIENPVIGTSAAPEPAPVTAAPAEVAPAYERPKSISEVLHDVYEVEPDGVGDQRSIFKSQPHEAGESEAAHPASSH